MRVFPSKLMLSDEAPLCVSVRCTMHDHSLILVAMTELRPSLIWHEKDVERRLVSLK